MKDYYDILGVPEDASREDIKAAYRILAHQFHPDKQDGNEKRFKEVNEAYRILSREESKAKYDETLRASRRHQGKGEEAGPQEENFVADSPALAWLGRFFLVCAVVFGVHFFSTDTGPVTYSGSVTPATDSLIATDTPVMSDDEVCETNYGPRAFADSRDEKGGVICDCEAGYVWNNDQTKCVVAPVQKTNDQICAERNAIYLPGDNTCICAWNYEMDPLTGNCVDPVVARDSSCAASYPGTSFLRYSEDGTRICDCEYGLLWNNDRTACVSRSSIDAICERDVGRNSRYTGTVTNGRYDCTQPY